MGNSATGVAIDSIVGEQIDYKYSCRIVANFIQVSVLLPEL